MSLLSGINKLTTIDRKNGKLNPYTLEHQTYNLPKANIMVQKDQNSRKIQSENKKIIKRIQSANTFYSCQK